jgi:hypothetical protein
MASPKFPKAMNQVGGATAGAHKQLGELMEEYLLAMNLPSRAQMVGMTERIKAIEGQLQLHEIKALLHQAHDRARAQCGAGADTDGGLWASGRGSAVARHKIAKTTPCKVGGAGSGNSLSNFCRFSGAPLIHLFTDP